MKKLFITGPRHIVSTFIMRNIDKGYSPEEIKDDGEKGNGDTEKRRLTMTNEELLATAEVALIAAGRMGKDFTDLKRVIHGLNYCIDTGIQESIDFARAVLLTEIEELKG